MILTSQKGYFRDLPKQCFCVFRALRLFSKHTFCMRGVVKIVLGGAKKRASETRHIFSRKRRNRHITTVPGQFRRGAKRELADFSSFLGPPF